MSQRRFEVVNVWHGEQRRSAYRIVCSACRMHEDFVNNGVRRVHPKAAEQRFRNGGWIVAKKAAHGLCADCIAALRARRSQVLVLNAEPASLARKSGSVVDMNEKAAPPPAMGRDEKRIINMKLHEVYVDERVGYDKGWTDARVSKELGVPRAWVTDVREDLFGPVREPEALAPLREAQTRTEERIADLRKRHEALAQDIAKIEAAVASSASEIARIAKECAG